MVLASLAAVVVGAVPFVVVSLLGPVPLAVVSFSPVLGFGALAGVGGNSIYGPN